jgi:hypothetical protein
LPESGGFAAHHGGKLALFCIPALPGHADDARMKRSHGKTSTGKSAETWLMSILGEMKSLQKSSFANMLSFTQNDQRKTLSCLPQTTIADKFVV